MTGFLARRYGAGPLHLIAHLAAFAIAGYALAQIVRGGALINFIVWFAGAAVLHDIVFLPFYSVLDRFAGRGIDRRVSDGHPPVINHVRAPALISGLLLLVYFPLILGSAEHNYFRASGHHIGGYARNWLLITAALFTGSAVIYAIRVRRQASAADVQTVIPPAIRRARELAREHSGLIPGAGLFVAAVTVIVGLSIKATTGGLGTPLPPFLMLWMPSVDPLAIVSAAGLAGSVALAPVLVSRVRRPAAFAAGLFVLALGLGLSLNVARTGVSGWSSVFQTGPHGSYEAANEYLPGLPALAHGVGFYVRHFGQLVPSLPVHVRGNPPGPLVALHLLGIQSAGALAALCIGLGALTAPLAYDLGRVIGGEERGRVAGVLTAFAPSVLLFGVTSADYAFATLGLCAACLLARPHPAVRFAGAVIAAVASFFSWLLLAIPVWAVLLALRREGRRRALAWAGVTGLVIVAFNGFLALALGYDPIGTLRATTSIYHSGISATRPYAYWVFGSPVAWALMLGLPTAWWALRSLAAGDPAAIALAGIVVTAAVLGFTKAETERIWLPFVPLACVAAAAVVSKRRLRPVLLALAVQALTVELLFNTVW